jgi:ABC-2 type transport system permease protein
MSLFSRQLYFELLKLFARKRTHLGFGAFLAVEVTILLLLQLPKAQRMFTRSMVQHGLDFSHFFSGLTVAYVMITTTVFLLGSLYLALVCGDIISKEVEDGTMRMVLSRPVSRLRILFLKYITCVLYTWALALFIVASSLLLGIADRGLGGLIVVAPMEHVFGFYEEGVGLERFSLAAALLCFMMLTISSLGFMLSSFNMKPASATVLTLSFYFVDSILRNVPYFENIKGYFLTYHISMWTQAFQPHIPWARLGRSVLYLGGFDLLFGAIAALYFSRRDFKS